MIGWIALQALAAAVVVVGLVLVVLRIYEMTQQTSIKFGENRELVSTNVGVIVLGLGMVFSLLVWLVIKPDDGTPTTTPADNSEIPAPVTASAPTAPNATVGSAPGLTATSGPPAISANPSTNAGACGSRNGPWSAEAKRVKVIVSDATADTVSGGKIRFTLRIDNQSNDFVSIDHSKILAIDDNGKQYGIDEASLEYGLTISSGEVKPASIVLDSPLRGSSTSVTLQFNFSSVFLSYWTISVCVPTPGVG